MSISNQIIDSVVAEMAASVQDMGEIVVIPNTFEVYIHRDDFRDVQHFLKELREQIVRRLDKEVVKRGGTGPTEGGGLAAVVNRLLGFEALAARKPHIRVQEHWDITFKECDGEILIGDEVFRLKKGEVCTVRQFASSGTLRRDTGFGTYVTIYDGDAARKSFVSPEAERDPGGQGDVGPVAGRDGVARGAPTATHFATLEYKYKGSSEAHVYHMDKERITVGREAEEEAPDLALTNVSNRISRKHLEIRADVGAGKFFLRALGPFGTTVDGVRVPEGRGDAGPASVREVELPNRARISLAGGEVLIDFTAG